MSKHKGLRGDPKTVTATAKFASNRIKS